MKPFNCRHYIRITLFNEQTSDGLKKAISDLTSQGLGKSSIPRSLIQGILPKIGPRNCPNQSYVRRITDSGHAPGVGG
jgi:hypothetical protein